MLSVSYVLQTVNSGEVFRLFSIWGVQLHKCPTSNDDANSLTHTHDDKKFLIEVKWTTDADIGNVQFMFGLMPCWFVLKPNKHSCLHLVKHFVVTELYLSTCLQIVFELNKLKINFPERQSQPKTHCSGSVGVRRALLFDHVDFCMQKSKKNCFRRLLPTLVRFISPTFFHFEFNCKW